MSEFSRGYSPKKLASLVTHAQRGYWVAELFKLWRPSGTSASDGLRLAVRNNTINLYRKGQSVAQVGLTGSVPWLSVHWKYALDAEPAKGPYVKMKGDNLLARDGNPSANFRELFNDWMNAVDGDGGARKSYSGREKCLIELLLSNPVNTNVIDLEVGIPSLRKRIDLATIETDADGQPCVYFGEVKHFLDGRMRKAKLGDGTRPDPEVVSGQLAPYANWLKDHKDVVGEAYIRAAQQMLDLWAAMGSEDELPFIFHQAAKCNQLAVCEFPRLIVISSSEERNEKAYQSWGEHKAILQNRFAEFPLLEIDAKTDQLTLATPF
jgi:hypothetical protein